MKLSEFYNQVVRLGALRDPRTDKKAIKSYPDTAILYGNPNTQVKNILVGIDIEVAELLLADRIRASAGVDLVLAHHPEGSAWAAFYQVMRLQVSMLVRAGVDKKVAEELLDARMREVERKVLPNNHMRSVDAARLLDLPFMCAHTPADNQVSCYIEQLMAQEKPKKVRDIIEILRGVPEYQEAEKGNCAPRVILGSPNRQAGRIFIEMTGGTEGSRDVFDKLYKTGVRTLVSMHLSEEHFKKVKDANLNVVIAGHISSDTLGLNLLLDGIEKRARESFQIISCSGFRRVKR